MKDWKYIKYIVRHKFYTFLAGLEIGVPVLQLIFHDISKFLPDEWVPYREFFYGEHDEEDWDKVSSVRTAFNQAWLTHIRRNKHHWQYWVLRKDNGKTKALKMPEKYLREMAADWIGVGLALGSSDRGHAMDWYFENKDKIMLHPETQIEIIQILGEYAWRIVENSNRTV